MQKILVIDNYDSFTYNLVIYLKDLNCKVTVVRNDKIDISLPLKFDRILISPGPGIPNEAGDLKKIIKKYATTKSILGVCLGHQAIAEVFGGTLINLKKVFHGIAMETNIIVNNEPLFKGLKKKIITGRYHSWVVDNNIPNLLEVTATDNNGNIMSIRHKKYDVKGVQFHPESILSPDGKQILNNWLNS
tara:strand:- start:652 stop:1218 length:567 start_codon:yes stop_codon:yes gene_type:complete